MWPWGHLTVGYFVYTVFTRLRYKRPPEGRATVALVVGTQLPDLIDKPLAWTLEVLPHGRSLGHSLFTAMVLIVAVRLLFDRQPRSDVTGGFGIGYLSHLLGDALQVTIASEISSLRFLVWPVVPAVEYETIPSFVGHVRDIEFSLFFVMQFGFVVLTTLIWFYDGKPGLMIAKRFFASLIDFVR